LGEPAPFLSFEDPSRQKERDREGADRRGKKGLGRGGGGGRRETLGSQ